MEILEINETHLAELGQRIADHGADSAGAELATLAGVAGCYGVAPGAVAALVDPASPDVVRERAFAVTALAVLRAAHEAAWDQTDVPDPPVVQRRPPSAVGRPVAVRTAVGARRSNRCPPEAAPSGTAVAELRPPARIGPSGAAES